MSEVDKVECRALLPRLGLILRRLLQERSHFTIWMILSLDNPVLVNFVLGARTVNDQGRRVLLRDLVDVGEPPDEILEVELRIKKCVACLKIWMDFSFQKKFSFSQAALWFVFRFPPSIKRKFLFISSPLSTTHPLTRNDEDVILLSQLLVQRQLDASDRT